MSYLIEFARIFVIFVTLSHVMHKTRQ